MDAHLLDAKAALQLYLQEARDAILWKLDGLGERDLRLPRTSTGTHLLGIVRHVANVTSRSTLAVPSRGGPRTTVTSHKATGLVGTVQGMSFMITSVFSGLSVGLLGMG